MRARSQVLAGVETGVLDKSLSLSLSLSLCVCVCVCIWRGWGVRQEQIFTDSAGCILPSNAIKRRAGVIKAARAAAAAAEENGGSCTPRSRSAPRRLAGGGGFEGWLKQNRKPTHTYTTATTTTTKSCNAIYIFIPQNTYTHAQFKMSEKLFFLRKWHPLIRKIRKVS